MLFKEWFIAGNPSYDLFNQKYGMDVLTWLLKRFGRYELMYSDESTTDLFDSMTFSAHIELLKLKKLIGQNEFFELGNKADTTANSTTEGNSQNNISYSGYNVEGDFNKTSLNSTGINTTNTTANAINLVDENIKITDYNFSDITKNIYNIYIDLFITLL